MFSEEHKGRLGQESVVLKFGLQGWGCNTVVDTCLNSIRKKGREGVKKEERGGGRRMNGQYYVRETGREKEDEETEEGKEEEEEESGLLRDQNPKGTDSQESRDQLMT